MEIQLISNSQGNIPLEKNNLKSKCN